MSGLKFIKAKEVKNFNSLIDHIIAHEKSHKSDSLPPMTYAGLDTLGRSAVSVPYTVMDGEREVDVSEIMDLVDLTYLATVGTRWDGVSFWLAIWNRSGTQLLKVRRIKGLQEEKNTSGKLVAYRRNTGDGAEMYVLNDGGNRRWKGRFIRVSDGQVYQLLPFNNFGLQEQGQGWSVKDITESSNKLLLEFTEMVAEWAEAGGVPLTIAMANDMPRDEQIRNRLQSFLQSASRS